MPRGEDLGDLFPDLDFAGAMQQRPAGIGSLSNVLRIAAAVTVSYALTSWLVPGANALFAPITALIVVQATPWRTIGVTLQRVAGAAIGVLLASLWVNLVGLTWWSMLIAVIVSLLVARQLKWSIGGQLQIPLAVVFVMTLGPGSLDHDMWRVLDVVIGGVIGMAFTVALPSRPTVTKLESSLRAFRQGIYDMLDAVARECGTLSVPLVRGEDHAFAVESRRMHSLSASARAQLVALAEGTHLNFRGRGVAGRLESDALRLQRLASIAVQARGLGGAANRLYDRAEITPSLPSGDFAVLLFALVDLMRAALGSDNDSVGSGDSQVVLTMSADLEEALTVWATRIAGEGRVATDGLASISMLGRIDHLRWQLIDYPRGA
jgi:hypothetical protein